MLSNTAPVREIAQSNSAQISEEATMSENAEQKRGESSKIAYKNQKIVKKNFCSKVGTESRAPPKGHHSKSQYLNPK